MDFTNNNLEMIGSLRLRNATVEERVSADRPAGDGFHCCNGTWWQRVKRFFFLPVSFLAPLRPNVDSPSSWRALGGYYHVALDAAQANGTLVTNEISEPRTFDLEKLKKNKNGARKLREIQKGLSILNIRRIEKLDDLLGDGRHIVERWQQRIGDGSTDVWHRHIDGDNFHQWASFAFHHSHDLLIGAYFERRLVAFARIKATDGVANIVNTFGDHSMHVTHQVSPATVLNYAFITISSQSPGIHKAVNGLRSLKDSLERYKAELGYRHVSYPAFIRLHQPAQCLARVFMPIQYQRLMGRYDTPDRYKRKEALA
jgi:hypothetical protein